MGQAISDIVISLEDISKCFRRYHRPVDRLKELFLPRKSYAEQFWALQAVDLEVHRGETLGIIGQNGSGKSTLLQIIAGTLQPTAGNVAVRGRVSALLELGSGFNPEFTGRQNVFFNGRILGLSQAEVAEKFDEIAAFADIGEFIDQPVKTYSSGMFVRLAFAVAINVNPEILIVDEALSVGDGVFVHRCMAKIKDFQDHGGTILFVSHDVGAVTRLCSQTLWMNNGKMMALGEPASIARQYQAWMYDQINAYQKGVLKDAETDQPEIETNSRESAIVSRQNPFTGKSYQSFLEVKRFGTGRAEVIRFEVLDQQDNPVSFVYPGDDVRITIEIAAFDLIQSPIVGVMVYDRLRTEISGVNNTQQGQKLPHLDAGETLKIQYHLRWPEIQGGNYTLEAAIADGSQENHEMLDWLQCPISLVSGVIGLTFGILRVSEVNITYDVKPTALLPHETIYPPTQSAK
ncbi:MAG: ABC transporter ATP-binding protein [Plectolyngbya sp. WJT66-NPBG17]|jgi:lipopolysaccharide transport system ATP-binding protein|nr:ABC transporter ATP-binding protein [Plectolyngbya sp. WJT66-NPBG17]